MWIKRFIIPILYLLHTYGKAQNLRTRKCFEVKNYSAEPGVVVFRPQCADPVSGSGNAQSSDEDVMRVRVPSARDDWPSEKVVCRGVSKDVNGYEVSRLSFDGAMKQSLYPESTETGVSCVIEDTNELWCRMVYA